MTNQMRCRNCRSKNIDEGITTEEWDYWYTSYTCGKCGNEWLVGDKKYPPTNPITNPVREGNKIIVTHNA